ncbi:MAG: nucleotide exchange factor GrpE [Candidatus Yanofskybacteria bacterium]|nr:nucleotide exchange factor GrpE [Candidatus Yanofskybacteria bacterium]
MAEEQNQNITNNSEELDRCQQEREEYLNNWKKERADFLNYKKDEVKRLEEFVRFANEAVILEVIEVIDDLERATKEVKNEGLDQVLKKFQDLLKRYGVERIEVKDAFDPLLHEAVTTEILAPEQSTVRGTAQNESENVGEKEEKLEEVRAGYTMHGQVIRPTRIKIIK